MSEIFDNPPAPFNPDYNPLAAEALAQAVAELTEERVYDSGLPRAEIAKLVIERVDLIMKEKTDGATPSN